MNETWLPPCAYSAQILDDFPHAIVTNATRIWVENDNKITCFETANDDTDPERMFRVEPDLKKFAWIKLTAVETG
jgi:hypothetical protein